VDQFLSWVTGLIAVIPGLGAAPEPTWSGYVEADYVYVGAVTPGPIESIAVTEGGHVSRGDVLFVLSTRQQQAQLAAAEARVEAARANLANLTTGSRKEEVEVIRANLAKAEADLSLAAQTLERSENLFNEGLIPQARLEQDRAGYASAKAQVDQLDAQLKVAELPARDAQQAAAEANLLAAEADAEKARSDLSDRTVLAPEDAEIERLFYAAGEMAATGVPVVSLLPAAALKIKFYVGEVDRHALAIGDEVQVTCDGCEAGLLATVSYLASEPQHTPPIIYSRDERERLVFLVEAGLEGSAGALPGQPVSVAVVP
jgi:HlyD family secretion protein